MTFKKIYFSSTLRQYAAGGLCSFSMAIVGILVSWPSEAIAKFRNHEAQVQPTNSELTWIVAALQIGNLVSTIPGCYLMDKIGRKTTLLLSATLPASAFVIIYFATSPYHIYIARFLCGISFGCNYMITPVYISEISEPRIRGSIGNIMAATLNSGVFYEYNVGPYVSYNTLLFLSMLVPLIFIITFVWMPESPYYYVMKNQNDKAIKSLTWLRYDKNEDEIIKEMNAIDESIKKQTESKGRYIDLVTNTGYRKSFIMVVVVTLVQRASGIGNLMNYASITVPKNSVSWLSINQCLSILSVTWLVANVTSIAISDQFNRKTLLAVSSLGCSVTTLAAGLWFYFKQNSDNDLVNDLTWIPFLSFLIHAEFYAIGLGSIGGLIRGELFSAAIRRKASALTQILSAIYSFVINKIYLMFVNSNGIHMNYFIYAISCLFGAIFIICYLIETRGKSLQSIQDELNGFSKEKKVTR